MGFCSRFLVSVAQEPVFVSVAQAAQAAGVFASPQLSQPYFNQKSQDHYFTVPVLARLFPAFAPPTQSCPL